MLGSLLDVIIAEMDVAERHANTQYVIRVWALARHSNSDPKLWHIDCVFTATAHALSVMALLGRILKMPNGNRNTTNRRSYRLTIRSLQVIKSR